MPVVVAPVLIGFVLLITMVVLYAMLRAIQPWLRSLLSFVLANHSSFWKRVLLYPVHIVAKGILAVEHAVASSLSHAVAYTLRPVTGFLNGSAMIVEEIALHLGSFAAATYDAFNTLRHVTIPGLIRAAVDPVKTIAVDARNLATDAEGRLDAFKGALLDALARTGIGSFTTISQGVNALVNYADRLHDKVWQDVVPKLEQAITVSIPALGDQIAAELNDLYNSGIDSLDGIRVRLRELEDFLGSALTTPLEWIIAALGTAAGLLALEGILTRIMPEFFCKNTRGVAKKLCGLDESLLETLLAGALGLLVALNVEEIAREAQSAYGAVDGLVHDMANG